MSTEAGNSPPLSYNSVDVDVRISQRTNGRDVIVFFFLFFGVGLNFRSNNSQPHFALSVCQPTLRFFQPPVGGVCLDFVLRLYLFSI